MRLFLFIGRIQEDGLYKRRIAFIMKTSVNERIGKDVDRLIQWYPGHMAKAKREMLQTLSLADVAIEVLDARAPEASRNPDLAKMFSHKPRVVVLNKEDMADPAVNQLWLQHYRAQGAQAVLYCATKSGGNGPILKAIEKAAEPVVARWAAKAPPNLFG